MSPRNSAGTRCLILETINFGSVKLVFDLWTQRNKLSNMPMGA